MIANPSELLLAAALGVVGIQTHWHRLEERQPNDGTTVASSQNDQTQDIVSRSVPYFSSKVTYDLFLLLGALPLSNVSQPVCRTRESLVRSRGTQMQTLPQVFVRFYM